MNQWTPEHDIRRSERDLAAYSVVGVARALTASPELFSKEQMIAELSQALRNYQAAHAALEELDTIAGSEEIA